MRTSLAGKTERGVTLLEMMIVVTLIALIAGLSFPSVASGIDTLRLRSASDSIVGLLNTALDRADRRQQTVEVRISPKEGTVGARSADLGFVKEVVLPDTIHIMNPAEPRRFLFYPGGAVPGIAIEISTPAGRRRLIAIDPITGVPRAETKQ